MKKWLFYLLVFSLSAEEGDFFNSVEELKSSVLETISESWGWCSQEKALSFIDLVLETKPQVCVEIGVFAGASFLPTAAALKFIGSGTAVAIDPWDKIECIRYLSIEKDLTDLRWWVDLRMERAYYGFLSILRQYELEPMTLTLKMTSAKAAPAIGVIDILHIDGNHYIDVALQDIQLYLPKVRQGGYIWFNDALWSTLEPAVQLLLKSCDLIKMVDNGNCILFKKK